MAQIPQAVANQEEIAKLESAGLKLISQGKVREIYALSDCSDYLLMVASNRLSIFDFVLPVLVPDKGAVLTAMTIWWLKGELVDFSNHLEAFGEGIDNYLPIELWDNSDLQKRAIVVRKIKMLDMECIVRGYLTGSGWRDYINTDGVVCGHQLPQGLHDGSKLDEPIFTPSTKSSTGHDENISHDLVEIESLGPLSIEIYESASSKAEGLDIIIADTKFEFGLDDEGNLVLADEVLTPDSSRFWDFDEWEAAATLGKSPSGFDKEPVRQYYLGVETPFGLPFNKLDPENPEHLAFVAGLQIPAKVVSATTNRYRSIFWRLIGLTLEKYQENEMWID